MGRRPPGRRAPALRPPGWPSRGRCPGPPDQRPAACTSCGDRGASCLATVAAGARSAVGGLPSRTPR
eukprot:11189253-Lingulodinium_polyedra.AAC.1